MNIFCKIFCFFLVTLSFNVNVISQDTLSRQKARPLADLIESKEPKVDSARLLTYDLDNITKLDSFQLKGLSKYFQHYDPARHRDFEYGHLGNMGSAAYPFAAEFRRSKGFKLGYTQYNLYHKTESDIKLFDQVRPFSELYFSGGETQSDLRVKALFSRSFANKVNWVLDYDRISQQGDYENQAVKQTSFLTSLAYRGNDRISLFFSYIINASAEEVNGGVRNMETLDSLIYRIRTAVPVMSEDAESRLQNQSLIFNAFYHLGQDSSRSEFINSLQYHASSFNEFFRFTDPTTTSDSLLYGQYWVSDRGIRNYNELQRYRNAVYLNSKFKDYYQFKAGLMYDYNGYRINSERSVQNELYLTFKGGIQLRDRLSIKADFYYGFLDIANEFVLDATANLRLTKRQGFNFGFNTSRYDVNQVNETVALNEAYFYNTDFVPVVLQMLSAEYYNNRSNFNIKVGGKLQNTFNFVYFDQESLPQQEAGLYTVSLLYGGLDFKYRSLLLENFVFAQNFNKDLLNLPTAFTKNSISYYGRLFKENMLVKAGLDFRYILNDFAPKYNPVIGQFYQNNDTPTPRYPLLDARLSFKVSSFTTFFKYENLTSFVIDDVERQVVRYPQFDARFRFGILWNLWN